MNLTTKLQETALAHIASGDKQKANLYLVAQSADPELLNELLITAGLTASVDDCELYQFLHKACIHTGLTLNDIVKKVNDTFQQLKTKLPIGHDIKELLQSDVLDVEGMKLSLQNIMETLKESEQKAEPQTLKDVYKYTIKNTKLSELDEMTRELVTTTVSEFKKIFDGTELNAPHFWTLLKDEASKVLISLDPVLRSRFVPLVQRYGQDALLKLHVENASVASVEMPELFTAAESEAVWDKDTIETLYQKIFYGTFPQDLVLLSMGRQLCGFHQQQRGDQDQVQALSGRTADGGNGKHKGGINHE